MFNLKKKFVIEQMWNQLIVNKYDSLIKINTNEINSKVDKIISENNEISSFDLSEIVFLEKNKKDNENKYLEIKKSIIEIGFNETAIYIVFRKAQSLEGKLVG